MSGDGGRQAQRSRARAGLAPPDDLVRVECDPDDSDERERDECRRDPLLALDVLLAHSRTLARTDRRRE
jgi:hypothetical protein